MSNFEWLDALGLDRAKLSQLPTLEPEELEQPKRSKYDLPLLPQPVQRPKYDARAENDIPSSLEGVSEEANSATEQDMQAAWAKGFLNCWQQLLQTGLLVHPAQQEGQDCRGCKHITMAAEHYEGTRRKFFWRCDHGHRQLEMGFNGERVIIAPPECKDYELPEEKKWS